MNLDRVRHRIRRGLVSMALGGLRLRNFVVGKFDRRQRFFAEYFTDRYVRRTFFPDFSRTGCMIEVGCATPQLLSMSQHFRESGWRCIGVEPNPRFVELHRAVGNEVYEYAAADFDADDCDFTVVDANVDYSETHLSGHSYSSLGVKPEYADYKGGQLRHLEQSTIKVRVRRLDRILETHCPDVTSVDLVSVDVEGYEIEAMKGFTPARYGTKVVVLENLFHSRDYTDYMESIGYRLHDNVKHNYIYVPAAADQLTNGTDRGR